MSHESVPGEQPTPSDTAEVAPATAEVAPPTAEVSLASAEPPAAASADDLLAAPASAGADATGGAAVVAAPPPAPPLRHRASGRPVGKVRSPVGCWLLAIITFGIYGLVWYHHTNKELKRFDPTIEVSPGIAVIALLVPVVNWFSVFNTGKRIKQAQLAAGIPGAVSPGLGVVLTFVFALWLPYYVSQANAVWESAAA